MVDTVDNWFSNAFAGGDDASAAPDINPRTGQPNAIPRNQPEPPQRRHRLVTSWTDKVKKAKRYWKPAFDRMREDQEFAFGKQWSKDASDRRYVANLTLRLVAQKTAFLYAKNPKAVAKKRPRLNATSWDDPGGRIHCVLRHACRDSRGGGATRPGGRALGAGGLVPPSAARGWVGGGIGGWGVA